MSSASSAPSVAVVGAGAAGLVAAIAAAESGARVELVESTADGGRKILISGGGRCNILPSAIAPERFVSDAPARLVRAMLRAWPLHEMRDFFERDVNVPLVADATSGKLFPRSGRARDVRDGLMRLARARGVELRFGARVTALEAAGTGWRLRVQGASIEASRVILATGGRSVPSTGSDGLGFSLAAGLGHRLVPTYPALTPLLTSSSGHKALAGVSLDVRLRAHAGRRVVQTRGGFLFTHRGYSGPAVLDISHLVTRPAHDPTARPGAGQGPTIRAEWAPLSAAGWSGSLAGHSALVLTVMARHVPARLAAQLAKEAGVPADRRASQLRREERTTLIDLLTAYPLPLAGDEGYQKAEVTGGGVALDEVDPATLESRRAKGLFLCGEILDAFGPIGGHNFAWAWATGRTAGLAAARA